MLLVMRTIYSIYLTISTELDAGSQEAAKVLCNMLISRLGLKASESFLALNLLAGNVPSKRYNESVLLATTANRGL